MLFGPLFAREAVTVPRRQRHYWIRGGYPTVLFVLVWTAWQEIVGGQQVTNVGDLARFGSVLFQILILVQLVMMLFLSPLAAAASVAQEKDRRTLVLLLTTDLRNYELVLGKLFSALLLVSTTLCAALPLFALCLLLGGVGWAQLLGVFLVTGTTALFMGSVGVTLAFWRDKTFQTLALAVLSVVLFVILTEALPLWLPAEGWGGLSGLQWAAMFSPRQALMGVLDPTLGNVPYVAHVSIGFTAAMLLLSAAVNGLAIARLRVWNPSAESGTPREETEPAPRAQALHAPQADPAAQAEIAAHVLGAAESDADGTGRVPAVAPPATGDYRPPLAEVAGAASSGTAVLVVSGPHAARRSAGAGETATPVASPRVASLERSSASELLERRGKQSVSGEAVASRPVWSNPIRWREMRTRAYGRRPILIKAAYLLFFLTMCGYLYVNRDAPAQHRLLPPAALALVAVGVVSLFLINAQAATSVSTERDGGALELLLVTDVTPSEFVYGKLTGALYNCKEILILPLALAGYYWFSGLIGLEYLVYIVVGLLVLYGFAAMLGVHAGLAFQNSRIAFANSLGTIFFLFVGMFVCINLIIATSARFERALVSFLVFILGGGVGLFASLGAKNPSRAIFLGALACPFLTFYAIVNFRVGGTLGVFLVLGAAYGWTTAAMLVPAIHEFDVTLGRTTPDQET